MTKKNLSLSIICILGFSCSCSASPEIKCTVNEKGQQVCFAEEVLEDLVKQSIYTVGNHMIQKYLNKEDKEKIIKEPSQVTAKQEAEEQEENKS